MIICQECHKENGKTKFCIHCGTPLSKAIDSSGNSTNSNHIQQNNNSTIIGMSKFKKTGIWVLAVLVLLVGMFFIGKKMYDPYHAVKEIEQAYIDGDASKLSSYFKVSGNTENDALITMIDQYGWGHFEEVLTDGIDSLIESNSNTKVISDSTGNAFITLNKESKLYGVLHEVELSIQPAEFYVVAPYDGTKVKINSHEIVAATANEPQLVGLFLPGEYNMNAIYSSEMGDFQLENPLSITLNESNPYEILFAENEVVINSDIPTATLFVNNESANQSVEEAGYLSSVPENSAVEVYAEFTDTDGTVYKSSVEKLSQSQVYLRFDDYMNKQQSLEAHEDNAKQLVTKFRDDYLDAITAADFNYVATYFEEASPIYKEYKKFVEDHTKFQEYSYEFLVNDITSFKQIEDNVFEVETFETFNFTSVTDGKYFYERSKKYSIKFVNDQYYLTEIKNLDSKKTKIE